MTRSRLTRSSMPPASGWPRWSRRTGQTGPLVSDAILAEWAEWADSTRFSTSRLWEGYDTAEVDAFREERSRHVSWGQADPRVMSDDLRGKQFSTHRLATTGRRLTRSLIRPPEAGCDGVSTEAMESTKAME